MAGSRSPSSSTNTEPSSGQVSSHPLRSATAPVKAPRRWPNSSDSTRVGERAEILMGKNPQSSAKEIIKCYYLDVRRLKRRLTFKGVDTIIANLEIKLYNNLFIAEQKDGLKKEEIITPLKKI